jgi:hypothetical protein
MEQTHHYHSYGSQESNYKEKNNYEEKNLNPVFGPSRMLNLGQITFLKGPKDRFLTFLNFSNLVAHMRGCAEFAPSIFDEK